MSIRKGDNVIAGASVGFIGKPDWSAKQQITSVPFTAPKDGIIIGACAADGTGSDHVDYYLNGAIIGTSHHVQNNYCASANMTIPVKTGDVFSAAEWYLPLSPLWFVPFEYSGVSDIEIVTPEYIRNLHDPDWNNPETMTFTNKKWTATKRGIVTIFLSKVGEGSGGFLVNNVRITDRYDQYNMYTAGIAPVSPGDVVTITGDANITSAEFVPYKAQ